MKGRKLVIILAGILALLAIISHQQWFNPWSILTHGDWTFWSQTAINEVWKTWGAWISNSDLGSPNVQITFLLFNSVWSLLGHFGFTYDQATKVTFFIPVLAFGFLSPFILAKRFFKDDIIAFALALFYGTTPYFLILQTGHLPIALVYALAPLMLYLFDRATDQNRLQDWLYFILVYWVSSCYEIRITLIVTLILAAYLLLVYRGGLKRVLPGLLVSGGVFLALSLFWLLPTVLGGLGSAIAAVADVGVFGVQQFDLLHALTIMESSWTGGYPNEQFILQPLAWYLWALPLLAFCSLLLARPRLKPELRMFAFFAGLALVGIFLTKEATAPFPSLYQFLYAHLPGFNLFREASKFYLLTALGYLGLFGYLLVWIKQRGPRFRRAAFIGAVGIFTIIAVWNLKPLIFNDYGNLFVSRTIPPDYVAFNRAITADTKTFFRTAWAPDSARWVTYSVLHPVLGLNSTATTFWKNTGDEQDQKLPFYQYSTAFLAKDYAPALINQMSIKYLGVAAYDIANDDNLFELYGNNRQPYIDTLASLPWLHRVNLGTKEVAVFENPSYKPYFSVLTKVVNLASLQNLEQKYSFITGALGSEFAFAPPGTAQPGTGLADPFESPGRVNVNGGTISGRVPAGAGETAYINMAQSQISYQVANDTLNFLQRRLVGLKVDGQPLGPQIDEVKPIDKTPLRANGEFVLGQGSALTDIDMGDSSVRDLGTPTQPPAVYSVEAGNRVANPELADGLWRHTVEDCNNYDSSPIISMNLVTDDQQASKVLELTADRHIACTGPDPVAVRAGESLMVNFDYRAVQGSQAGYQLVWSGPGVVSGASVERNYLPVTDNSWRTLQRLVTVPAGATSLRVLLEAIPNDQRPVEGIARYTNLRVSGLTVIDTPPVATEPQYAVVPLPAGAKTVSVTDPALSGRNLIANPSLESGLWQPAVGDCNAYDDNPAVGQQLDTREYSAGRQSLELTAKRHIACTGPPAVSVQEGHTYLLSVDYQSPNAKTASVSVSFNDPNHSRSGNTSITVPDANWHTFNQTFTVPFGATKANITVSASAADPAVTTIINRYDNLRLTEIAPAAGQYYLVGAGPANLRAPAHISFTLSSPTKKLVHVTGATTPFYLAMSEAYHPGWRLELANSRSQGGLASWWPWAHPQAIGNNNHFSLDDFLNGWYIDPAALCHTHAAGCTINKDGSYNLELVAEFAPQRWFYFGLIISITTLLACLGYLVRIWRARRHRNTNIKKRHPTPKG